MTTEVLNGGAPASGESTTPEAAQDNAATTQAQTGGAEGGEEGQVTQPRTYTEDEMRERVERATAKAAAKAERRAFREARAMLSQGQPTQQTSQPANDGKPTRAQYASDDAFVEALTDWKLEQRDNASKQEREAEKSRSLSEKTEKIYAEAEKLPGFDRDAFDELPLTKSIVEALIDSETPAKLMHYMASNPEEIERIAKLSPARQAAELGKLEASLPKTPKTSKAPDPSGNPAARGNTTTVPTDPSKMSHEQYRAWRKQNGARWAN